MRLAFALAVAALLLTAGCLGGAAELYDDAEPAAAPALAPPASIEDVVGDAADGQWEHLSYGPNCRVGCRPLEPAPEGAGWPAPWMDLAKVSFVEEQRDTFTVSMELASVDERFAELDAMPGVNRFAEYRACWTPSEDAAERCAQLHVGRIGSVADVTATFDLYHEGCGGLFDECAWPIEAEVSYGEPATITWTVPKAYAAYDGAPLAMATLRGESTWYSIAKAAPLWHAAYSLSIAGNYEHYHNAPGFLGDVVDLAEPAAIDVHMTPSDAPFPANADAAVITAPEGNLWGDGAPRDEPAYDLLATELFVEDGETVLRYTIASMESFPLTASHYDTLVAVTGQSMVEMGVRSDTTIPEPYGYMGQCIGFHCDDPQELRVPVAIEYGTPATMEVRFPAEHLGFDHHGKTINFLWTITMAADYSVMVGEHDDEHMLDWHAMSLIDAALGADPYVIGGGEPMELVEHEQHEH